MKTNDDYYVYYDYDYEEMGGHGMDSFNSLESALAFITKHSEDMSEKEIGEQFKVFNTKPMKLSLKKEVFVLHAE